MPPIVSEEHREERKLAILHAAKEVFIRKGFHAATIQDIIDESGISRGGVYTYFQNTEDIFIELLRRRDQEDAATLAAILPSETSNWEALCALLEEIQVGIEQQKDPLVPAIYEYYFTMGRGTKKHIALLENRIEQTRQYLVRILQRGVDDGEYSPKVPIEDVARTIITFGDGIYVNSFHLGANNIKIKEQFDAFRNYLAGVLL